MVERGTEITTGRAERFELQCYRGDVLHDLGAMPRARAAYEEALAAAEGEAKRCRALIGLAAVKRVTDDLDGALADLAGAEAAAEAQGLSAELSRIHVLRGNLCFPRGDIPGCLREHGRGLELARRAGSAELEAAALGGLGDAEYARGRMVSAHARLSECVELSRRQGLAAPRWPTPRRWRTRCSTSARSRRRWRRRWPPPPPPPGSGTGGPS